MPKDQFIIDVWERLEKDMVGAAELELISDAVTKSLGTPVSPALIARVLADHGARLGHPDILHAAARWREQNSLFAAEDLTLGSIEAARALAEKIENLRRQFVNDTVKLERLRQSVRQIKEDLDLAVASRKMGNKDLAREVAQWLTVWLQNPQIFQEWLALRRTAPEFQKRFGP